MANPDLLNIDARKAILEAIHSPENIDRKRYEQRKFDIYRNRQAQYVLERLSDEFSSATVARMRKVLSINPCKRIVDQMGSIYAQEPERHFSGTGSAGKSNEELEKKLDDFYHHNAVDPNMRLANRYYKLCDQAALYVVPRLGKITPRALTPKDYDVVPDENDPEQAFAYILNVFDINLYGPPRNQGVKEQNNRYYGNAGIDSAVADDSDRAKLLQRFVVWTNDLHFTMNGHGEFVGEVIPNPINRLPFIDIAVEKDFQFFVKRGNNVAEFTIDLLVQLSDLAEISRLQGYSQAIIYSSDEPKDLVVGPNKVMWIKQNVDGAASQPKFAFESPSPDLANSLEIINTQLKMFLSSIGLDASTVSGDTPKRAFTSGIDHLLANIDKFEASQEDVDLFRRIETDLFSVMRDWSNAYQDITGEDALNDELKIGQIDDKIDLEVCYAEPAIVQTQTEKEDSVIKRWDNELLTTKDALKELYDYDDAKAEEYLTELAADKVSNPRPAIPTFGALDASGKPAADASGGPPQNGKAPPAPVEKPMPNGGQKVQ